MPVRGTLLALGLLWMLAGAGPLRADGPTPSPAQVFEKRLKPIFDSPNPSSCVQCHLAGVDLKNYILPDSEKTFRSLRDQGLIDTKQPKKSKILALIQMGDYEKKGSALIHEKVRKAEYEAFAAWLEACCADKKLLESPPLDEKERKGPSRPAEVIRHSRKDRLLESFERNVWSIRTRCMNCHTEGSPQADKNVKKHGPAIAWFKKGGPEATMDYLLSSKLIDVKEPTKSLLLRKPLGEVEHEGGVKILVGDAGYKALRGWLEDLAAIRGDKYAKAEDLPKKEPGARFGTDIWFKLTDTPDAWGDKLLQVSVYAWDAKAKKWEDEPIAISDRKVWGKGKLWQHNLVLLAPEGSERDKAWRKGTASLPAGKYLARVHVDAKARLEGDWKSALGKDEYVGRAEFEARWREGYGAMSALDARKVKP
jgi:hypothetical protein